MSVLLGRHAVLTTISLECRSGIDAQGKPSYAAAVSIEGYTKKEVKQVNRADGSVTTATLSVWTENTVLEEGDRLTVSSEAYIIVERREVKRLNGIFEHNRCRCRDE